MGIREDIRAALGSIAAAIPESVRTMRHGDGECGAVVQSSSREFADDLTTDGPTEAARFRASAADFPTLERGAAVELEGTVRVVTSLNADPVGATFSFGLSAEFEKCPAAWSGRRAATAATGARAIAFTIDALVLEDDAAPSAPADSIGPSDGRSWTVCVRAADWPEVEPPQVGDEIRISDPHDGRELRLRAASISRGGGWWTLRVRPRGVQW